MAFYSNGQHLPSTPENASPRPQYSTQASDTSYSTPRYTDYSHSIAGPLNGVSEYDYDSSILKPNLHKNQSSSGSFGSRVYSAFSDAVKTPSTSNSSIHSRAKSLADTAGPMLARTTSIRLGGLLNRTPTQKQAKPTQEPAGEDYDEPEEILDYKPTLTSTPERSSRVSTPRTHTPSRTSPQKAGRFSWFANNRSDSQTSVPTTPRHTNLATALELEDPLLSLNINATLFPPTSTTDPTDPASFTDLLQNATALIDRLQLSYRDATTLTRQANAERDAALEETEEAATRAAHLKSQLETMAARAAEQDRAMRDLAEQLAAERQARREDEARALRNLRAKGAGEVRHDSFLSGEEGTPRQASPRKGRRSDGVSSDSGFESEMETETDAETESISFSVDTASELGGAATPATGYAPSLLSPTSRGGDVWGQQGKVPVNSGVWGVVGDLQRENQRLRGRVRELEGAVEGCLSLVG